jgi:hypothetical protein
VSGRNGTETGVATRLFRRFVWRGDATAKVAAVAQLVVAMLAVAAAVLGVTGVAFLSSELFRAVALLVAAVVLLTQLLMIEERERQVEVLNDLKADVENHLPHHIDTIVTKQVAAISDAGVREIAPAAIEPQLLEILGASTGWTFQGGSGHWLRSATLPQLAKTRNEDVEVVTLLLDPRNTEICRQWVQSRFSRRYQERSTSRIEPRMIQTNILATIYSLAWYSAYSRIRPTIVLLNSFSSQRYDVGSTGLVITVATRTEPAIYASRGSWFYETVCSDLEKARRMNPVVILPAEDSGRPLLYPQLDDVRAENVLAVLRQMSVVDVDGGSLSLLDDYASPDQIDAAAVAREVRQPRLA